MLLEQRGMNMQGWNLKTLAQEINNTPDVNIKATAVRYAAGRGRDAHAPSGCALGYCVRFI